MRIAMTSMGDGLDAPPGPRFDHSPYVLIIDTHTRRVEPVEITTDTAAPGIGVTAAQLMIERGVEAVVTPQMGTQARHLLDQAHITVYRCEGRTVGHALDLFKALSLPPLDEQVRGGAEAAGV